MGKRKKKRINGDAAIAYQNKDIVSKVVDEELKGKPFSVYGIDVPKIIGAGPTSLPAVEANELQLDNLLYFEDGYVGFVDYESRYSEENHVKYLNYVARIEKRIYNEYGHLKKIRIIIIYTADVERENTKPQLDLGGFRMSLTEAFLMDMDPAGIREALIREVQKGGSLSDGDLMRLIIYPLTFRGDVAKREAVREAVGLAKGIADERKLVFALKMIYAFSDKFISDEDARNIKEVLTMTKVDLLYAQEREAAVRKEREKNKKALDKEREENKKALDKEREENKKALDKEREEKEKAEKELTETKKALEEEKNKIELIAKNMLRSGDGIDKVVNNTGLPRTKVAFLLGKI